MQTPIPPQIRSLLNPEAIKAELAKRSLYEFVRQAWHVVEPATPFVDSGHLKIVCDELQRTLSEPTNLVINIPPRCSKSLITCVFFPAWCWTHSPHLRFLTASYANSIATRDNVKARRIIESPWYQERWGHVYKLADDQNQKTRYENDKGGHRIICSPDAATTAEGGDILIVDDALNAKDANSESAIAATISWWDESFYNRLNDATRGSRIVIGQRLHEQDLPGYVLSTCKNVRHVCLPAEYDPAITTHSWGGYEAEGDLLAPERLPAEILDELKGRGSRYYAGQYGQRPSPAGGNIIRKDWIKYYTSPPEYYDTVIQSWDLSFKGNATNDYVVGTVWGTRGAKIYLIDMVREKLDFPGTIEAIRRLKARYPHTQAIYVEDKANGPAVISSLSNQIPGIIAVNPRGSKDERLSSISYLFEAGNVELPLNAPWSQDVVNELTNYPSAPHDDICDSTSMALLKLQTASTPDVVSYKY